MIRVLSGVVLTCGFAFVTPSQADTLDFSIFAAPSLQEAPLLLPNARITTPNDGFFIPGIGSDAFVTETLGFCAVEGEFCLGNAEIRFTLGPVGSLTFNVEGVDQRDSTLITAFSGDRPLDSVLVEDSDTPIDFSDFNDITRLLFEDQDSQEAGVVYTNFQFEQLSLSDIPVPATLPLLAGSLATIAVFRRRSQSKTPSP